MANLVSTLKLNQTMKHLLLFSFLIILSSCSSNTIEIDNPTDKSIEVTLGDNPPIKIKAFGNVKSKVSDNVMMVNLDGKSVGQIKLQHGVKYLLNPTLSVYYIEEVVYSKEGTLPISVWSKGLGKGERKNPDEIEFSIFKFDEAIYAGDAKVDSSLLIKNIWNFGVREILPKQVRTNVNTEERIKIYREEYFAEHAKRIFKDAMKEDLKKRSEQNKI